MINKKWDVYVYGDVNIDLLLPRVEKLPDAGVEEEVSIMESYVGGGAALFTLGLGKLGLHPIFQGRIGNDCYGDMILNEFTHKNVDCSCLKRCEEKTGISICFTDAINRSFLTFRGANALLDIEEIHMEKVKLARHVHMTGYSGSKTHASYLSALKRVKEETDATVSFDVGWDTGGEWSRMIYELFPYIDVLFMNETEAMHYSRADSPEQAAVDFAGNFSTAVIKLGRRGALAVNGKNHIYKKAFQVKAIDTTGAGDSFNAGFIYGYLEKKNLNECLTYGNACGALNVTAFGGNTGFPDREALYEFIGKSRESENRACAEMERHGY